jgi:hypothetical protein
MVLIDRICVARVAIFLVKLEYGRKPGFWFMGLFELDNPCSCLKGIRQIVGLAKTMRLIDN